MPWTVADVDEFNSGLSDSEKEQWVSVANERLQACLDEGGSQDECEETAIRVANGVVNNSSSDTLGRYSHTAESYPIELARFDGRMHMVVPVVMMVEGVHSGSHGPLLYLSEDLARFPEAWNGIPVTLQHPSIDGNPVSANHPEVLDEYTVGRVFNAQFDNGRLRGEAWIDQQRTEQVAPELYTDLKNGKPIEVSVGVFNDEQREEGDWRGEEYVAIARNHRPDHLALLPGGRGACSWEDGCGIRANEQEGAENEMKRTKSKQDSSLLSDLKSAWQTLWDADIVQINAQGYREIMSTIQQKLDVMDTDTRIHFLADVFEDTFVYEIRQRGNAGESQFYRREYSVQDDGSVEFGADPQPVRKTVEYVDVNPAANEASESETEEEQTEEQTNNTEEGVTEMSDTQKSPCCEEKIDMLINSEHTEFTADDKEWLGELGEEKIQKFVAMENGARVRNDSNESEQDEDNVVVNKEDLQDPDTFISMLPKPMQETMRRGLKLHQEQKAQVISKITAHGFGFAKEELEQKDLDELEKIAQGIPARHDYSGNGSPGNNQQGSGSESDDVLVPIMTDDGRKE
jgi:hypothetical protein